MHTDIATRAQVVTLKSCAAMTTVQVMKITGLSKSTINTIYARAIERGFDPNVRPIKLLDEWFQDLPRSGRPTKQSDDLRNEIITRVERDQDGREKPGHVIAAELSHNGIKISEATVLRTLKQAGYRKTKPTRKPGLTKTMTKKERLEWRLTRGH